MTIKKLFFLALTAVLVLNFAYAAEKPKLTLDEFFNSVSFDAIRVSPDGRLIVIVAERPDWDQNIFRKDMWLYRDDGHGGGTLTQLTQSGHDGDPQWSPDGRWIAFLTERKAAKGKDSDSDDSKDDETSQLYLISPNGGEAFPVTQGDEEIHALADDQEVAAGKRVILDAHIGAIISADDQRLMAQFPALPQRAIGLNLIQARHFYVPFASRPFGMSNLSRRHANQKSFSKHVTAEE